MKAQFKYAFLSGFHGRIYVLSAVFIMNLVFIIFESMNMLPFAALITAISLGGVGIAVMMAFNIVNDISIMNRMFSPPGAYLYALTPVPRWKTLLAGILSITVMDIVTMALVICGEVWLSLSLAGESFSGLILEAARANISLLYSVFVLGAVFIAGYLFLLMIILFSVTMKKSYFYNKRAGGFLCAVLVLGIVYISNISGLLLAPFGIFFRYGIFITISLNSIGTILYLLLTLIKTGILFIVTSKLMERKINI